MAARRVLHTTNLLTLEPILNNTVPVSSIRWFKLVFLSCFPSRLPRPGAPRPPPTDLLHVEAQHAAWCGERVDGAEGGELKTLTLMLHDGRAERRLSSARVATGLPRVDTCAPG